MPEKIGVVFGVQTSKRGCDYIKSGMWMMIASTGDLELRENVM